MTSDQMKIWLCERYDSFVAPDFTKEAYVAANLPHMARSAYWKQRAVDRPGWVDLSPRPLPQPQRPSKARVTK